MKRYRITVDGKVYEVEVEEIVEAKPPLERPKPAASAPSGITTPPKPSAEPKAPVVNDAGGEIIKAPMPGVILDIKVSPGEQVQRGSVLFILEAMKMENEIPSPVSGTVKSVVVSKGASVNTGDTLAVIG